MTSNFQSVVANALFEECTKNFLMSSHIKIFIPGDPIAWFHHV
jgi:hypothetical protein